MTNQLITCGSLLFAATLQAGTTQAPYMPPAQAPMQSLSLLSYNTFEASWIHTEFDFPNLDSSDGVAGSFSYSPAEHFYVTGGGAWQTIDILGDSADLWLANAGLGGYISLSSNIDFVAEVGAAFYGYSNSIIGDDNGSSAYVRPHFRGRWGNFEVHAGATWSNLNITNEWSGFSRFYLGLTDNFDLSAGISAGKEEYTLNAGIRFRY